MGVIDDVKGNGITELELTDMPEEYFGDVDDFCDALKANTSITKLSLTGDFIACCMGKERSDVLEAAASMSSQLSDLTLGGSGIMVQEIKEVVQKATSLTALTLEDLVLQGIQSDYDAFEKVLWDHKALKSFQMKDCVSSNELNMCKLEDAGNKIGSGPTPIAA